MRPAMLVRLRPRPDTLHVSRNRTVLATGPDGFCERDSAYGLIVHETRVLSCYRWLMHGMRPKPVALSNVDQHSWMGYYIAPVIPSEMVEPGAGEGLGQGAVEAAQRTIELRLTRFVGDGMREEVAVTNYAQRRAELRLELEVDADFADQEEIGGRPRRQRGRLRRRWGALGPGAWALDFDYTAEHSYSNQGESGRARIERGLTLRIRAPDEPSSDNGRIRFELALEPGACWRATVEAVPRIDGRIMPPEESSFDGAEGPEERKHRVFLRESTQFGAPGEDNLTHVVIGAMRRAAHDLSALRLHDLDHGERAWTMSAGLPVYISLFGRDTLTAAWQGAMLGPEMMSGTLAELARWQGTTVNDWRDEQPGRMIHEAHTGPLEALNYNPRARSYGSVTTSAFYPVCVSELWHWTADKEAVGPLIDPALRAIAWLDEWGDLDGDGIYEYRTRSEQGVQNQAWKDSGDAIVDEDGAHVEPPIATCEEQGFVYLAKLHMSEVLWWFGRKDEARRLFDEAAELKKRFNELFWSDELGFYVLGLDSRKRQIRSVTSNPGHCLASGLATEERARRTADRLLAPDLFSGWGVRTLSSENAAYNPYSYHRGTVWPVEQATFALAFFRYGLWEHLERLSRAQFEAASLFDFYRLPECFSGHPRDAEHPFPAIYPQANWPQAWSSSAVFCFVQALLGLYPYAPLRTLIVDPHLPEWLPEITVGNLRVGEGSATIRFYRRSGGDSAYEVLERRGTLHVLRQPSPWSLSAGWWERTVDALASLLPGR